MTHLDAELAALRTRRPGRSFSAWLRRHRPFDRRTIRDPRERDAYYAAVQRRLTESEASFILERSVAEPPHPPANHRADLAHDYHPVAQDRAKPSSQGTRRSRR